MVDISGGLLAWDVINVHNEYARTAVYEYACNGAYLESYRLVRVRHPVRTSRDWRSTLNANIT